MSNYGLELYIDGNNTEYIDKIFKYLSSEESTPKDVQSYLKIIDRNMLKNEHYIVTYYMMFLNKIETLVKIDFNLITEFTKIDKDKIVKLNNIDLDGIVDIQEEIGRAHV